MADPNPRTFTVLAATEIGDDRLQWIEIMPTADKARNGPFYFTVTADDLDVYANYIRENGDRIVVDYDHEGADGGSTVAAGWFTGEARITDTDRGPILEAQVEWTPQGLDDIQSKRFRFISPEFNFQEREAKTGLLSRAKQIIAATLTNRPFFTELAAVAAAADVVWDGASGYMQRMAEVNEALNGDVYPYRYYVMDVGDGKALVCEGDDYWVVPFTIGPDGEAMVGPVSDWQPAEQQWVTAPAEARALADAVREARAQQLLDHQGGAAASTEEEDMDLKVLAATLGLPEDADMETVTAAVAEHKQRADEAAELEAERKRLAGRRPNPTGGSMPNDELIAALGLADDADEAQVMAAVRRAKAGSDRLEQLEQENERLTATAAGARKLEARVKSLEAERQAEQVDRIIGDGIRSGRVVPAEKAALAKQFATNPDGLREVVDARPEHLFALAGRGAAGDVDEGDDVVSVKAQFASAEADGVDTDSARLHVRTMQILREQGKGQPTEAEYVAALEQASDPVYTR